MKLRRTHTLFCLILVALAFSTAAYGQNNPYQIDDEVYKLFSLSRDNKGSEIGLEYALKGQVLARELGDMKGLCVCSSAEMSYYFAQNDLDKLMESAEKLKVLARQYGYPQYYYHAYSQECTCNINCNKSLQALELAEKFMQEAEAEKNEFGMFSAYRTIAGIYQGRQDKDAAIKYYKKAIQWYWESSLKNEQSIAQTYASIATLLSPTNDESVQYAEQILKNAKTYQDSLRFLVVSSELYFQRHDKDGFYRHFNVLKRTSSMTVNNPDVIKPMVYDAIYRREFDEARSYVSKTNMVDSLALYACIDTAAGDWVSAYKRRFESERLKEDERSHANSKDIAELSVRYNTEHIQYMASQTRHKMVIIILTLVILIVCIAAIVFVYALFNKRRQYDRLKVLTDQIEDAKEKAEVGSRMKDLFVQNMSHEIRTPLNAIMGFSQLLAAPGLEWTEDDRTSFGQIILNNGEILTMLIDDILNISDIESGNYKISITSVNVRRLLESAHASVEYRIPEGVKFSFKSDVPDDFMIYTDPGRVQQVLINFLTNACKHTMKGGIILGASLSEVPGMITFSVTDTGEGIPEGEADYIFERFTKLDAFKQGTGLGLNICRTISQKLHGTVKVDSSYKAGARFIFIHPLDLEPIKNTIEG